MNYNEIIALRKAFVSVKSSRKKNNPSDLQEGRFHRGGIFFSEVPYLMAISQQQASA
jgi:hypothetical protein